MSDEIIKEVTQAEAQIEPISEPKVIIQPESEVVKPTKTEPISTPQLVEVLKEASPEPEIAPKTQNIEQVEPISTETPNELKTEEIPVILPETLIEETKPTEIPPQTTNEPEIVVNEQKEEKTPDLVIESTPESTPEELPSSTSLPKEKPPAPIQSNSIPPIISNKTKMHELFIKAKNAIQFRKRKKLDKVMALFLKKSKITNDEVEKFLHVSDATATRYLSQLEKEGKIKQSGKTGKSVFYIKI